MWQELKDLCWDFKVPLRTRKIAYALFNSNRKAAIDYIKGWPARKAVLDRL